MRKKRQPKRNVERASLPATMQPANMMVIPESMMQAIYMQQSPQKNTQGESMLPGAPLEPYKGIMPKTGPRIWNFPIGWNIGRLSRSPNDQEVPTFHQLRTLARAYDGIQMCERVWMDLIGKVQMVIKPRADLLASGDDEGDSKFQADISKYMKWFEKPDRQHYLHEWLCTAIVDQLEIDALAIYMHPARDGSLYAMEILDGSTLKPLLDDRGRQPEPPYPAYQQYLYNGLPGVWLTSQQLLYVRESPRSDSPYGISRVERIITRVNQALRKQQKDLARYTDGNIPAGILELPPGDTEWTSDQVAAYQQMFDALLAGNDAFRSRIKVMPPGTEYTATDEPSMIIEFDKFLLNATVAAFGLSMGDLAFTEDVNRSSGDSQENMTIRRTLLPLLNKYATLFTQVLKDYFHDDRFVVSWGGYEEPEDLEMQANAYKTMISAYMISPSDAARKMHLPVSCEIPSFFPTATGPLFFEDLLDPKRRQAQQDAQMAGFQLAAQNPGAKPGQQPPGEDDSNAEKETQGNDNSSLPASKSGDDSAVAGENTDDEQSPKASGTRSIEPVALNSGDGRGKALQVERAESQQHTGIMIAFMLDPDTSAQLALPSGEDPSDMHCTLAFMGDMNDPAPEGKLNPAETPDVIKTVLSTFASGETPIQGTVGGLGRFSSSPSSDGQSPVIALVNAPGLQDWRRRLVHVLESARYQVANDFDYTPHITLAYIPDDAPMPIDDVPRVPLNFNTLCLAIGDERHFFPIGQPIKNNESETTNETTSMDEETSTSADTSPKGTGTAAGDSKPQGEDSSSGNNDSRQTKDGTRAMGIELKRWRACALHDIKSGKRLRAFDSDILPVAVRASISSQLEGATTSEEVRAVFQSASLVEEQPDFLAGASLSRGETNPNGVLPTNSRLLWKNVSPIASGRS